MIANINTCIKLSLFHISGGGFVDWVYWVWSLLPGKSLEGKIGFISSVLGIIYFLFWIWERRKPPQFLSRSDIDTLAFAIVGNKGTASAKGLIRQEDELVTLRNAIKALQGGTAKETAAIKALRSGEPDKAASLFKDRADELSSSGRKQLNEAAEAYKYAGALFKLTSPVDAAIAFAKAVELNPRDYYSLNSLGASQYALNKFDSAFATFQKLHDLALKSNNQEWVQKATSNAGRAQQALGNLDPASQLFEDSLSLAEKMKDNEAIGDEFCNLGVIKAAQKDVDGAQKYFERDYQLSKITKNADAGFRSGVNLAKFHYDRGNNAMEIMRSKMHPSNLPDEELTDAKTHFAKAYGYAAEALSVNAADETAIDLYFAIGDSLGQVISIQMDDAQAVKTFQSMLDMASRLALKPNQAQAHLSLGIAYFMKGDREQASKHIQAASTLAEQLNNRELIEKIEEVNTQFAPTTTSDRQSLKKEEFYQLDSETGQAKPVSEANDQLRVALHFHDYGIHMAETGRVKKGCAALKQALASYQAANDRKGATEVEGLLKKYGCS